MDFNIRIGVRVITSLDEVFIYFLSGAFHGRLP